MWNQVEWLAERTDGEEGIVDVYAARVASTRPAWRSADLKETGKAQQTYLIKLAYKAKVFDSVGWYTVVTTL